MRPYKENKRKQILAGLLFLVLGFCGCASEKKEEIGAREPAVYFVQERTDLFDETDLNEPAGELRAGSYCGIICWKRNGKRIKALMERASSRPGKQWRSEMS